MYKKRTRNNCRNTVNENESKVSIIVMDDYFTLPKIMKKLRDINIGIVGTAQGRVG